MDKIENRPSSSSRHRKSWVAPHVERLASSEAEFGAGTHLDAEGMS